MVTNARHTPVPIDPVIPGAVRRVLPGSGRPVAQLAGPALIRLRRALYFGADEWAALTSEERYRAYVTGVARGYEQRPVLSHQSAAVLWRLPIIGPWPREVHFLVPHASGGRSDPGIRRHAVGVLQHEVVELDGLLVTSLARTIVDLATTAPLYAAVAAADAALWVPRAGGEHPRLTKAELWQTWEHRANFRGRRRAQQIIEFAETGAESALESASRVTIALAGFPRPELQRRFTVDGKSYDADFYWREADAIGECDGLVKYLDPVAPDPRSATLSVLAEKRREDALRRQVRGFTRWGSDVALSQNLMTGRLIELGLRPWNHRPRHLSWPPAAG
jgi:hypothetical protein